MKDIDEALLPQQPLLSLSADEPPLQKIDFWAFSKTQKSIFPYVPQFSKVFEFIETNYHRSITLNDVALAVGYSPAYLTTLISSQTGKTVNCWIIKRRIVAACSLLLNTNQSVEQIATAVGYQNVCFFFRQFRQHLGTTPCAWKREQREKAQGISMQR